MLLHIRDKEGDLLFWSKRLNGNVRVGSANRHDNIPERKLTLSEYSKWLRRNSYKEHTPYWKKKNIVKNKNALGWSR